MPVPTTQVWTSFSRPSRLAMLNLTPYSESPCSSASIYIYDMSWDSMDLFLCMETKRTWPGPFPFHYVGFPARPSVVWLRFPALRLRWHVANHMGFHPKCHVPFNPGHVWARACCVRCVRFSSEIARVLPRDLRTHFSSAVLPS